MPRRKRAELIDLTDDGDGPTTKRSALDNESLLSPESLVEPEAIDLTQEDEGIARELYGHFDGRIVGVRYYRGLVTSGEFALCHREPNNQFDSNAVRVDNVVGDQIGHLPRKIVEKLSPYMDSADLEIEAQLTGEKTAFDCPVRLFFYGPSDLAQRLPLEERLKKDKLIKATQLKQTRKDAENRRTITKLRNGGTTVGLGVSGEPETGPEDTSMDQLLEKSQVLTDIREGDAIKTLSLGQAELEAMPKAQQPHQLKSALLPYQLQGLAWMTAKEAPQAPAKSSEEIVQLWRRSPKGNYLNVASDYICSAEPKLMSGGILADDMGLGKTLQIISLILTGGPGPTLIVAPVSVMSNWQQQALQHVKEECAPRVLIYHGSTKATAAEMKGYDIVITTYGKLQRELEDGVKQVLLSPSMVWRRVVLEEGHNIRNATTKVAQAACKLNAQSRWVLSGTPIINSVKDLHSLVKFLHMTGGIEKLELFNAKITRPLAEGVRAGELLLQALMQDICLRRHKQMKFVDLKLPEKKEYMHSITFKPEEKLKYNALLSEARGALEEYQQKSAKGQKGRFTNVLERLLRLRQTCNHWTLCRERVDDLLKMLEEQDVVSLTDKNRKLLQRLLQLYIESQEECAICYEVPKTPVITHCKHAFCRPCIAQAIKMQGKCPMCRNMLTEKSLLEPEVEGLHDNNFDVETQSSKTEALLQILRGTLNKDGSKVIIFSQWTSFLNIVQNQLDVAKIKYTRIDGKMTADKRDRAIHTLDNDPDTRVMLASLAVCGVGLNLVSADTVILSDSWWAPAIEDQAVDRVHRLGQKRETTVWRLVMEDSIEDRVLSIQHEKRDLVSKAFQGQDGQRKKAKESRMKDVMQLLT